MTLTAEIEKLDTTPAPYDPSAATMDAVRSIIETCNIQFEQEFAIVDEAPDLDQALTLGLPLYLEGGNSIKFVRSGTKDQAKLLKHADGSGIQVHLIWREGTKK